MVYSQDGKHIHMTADGGIVIEAKGQNLKVQGAKYVEVVASGRMKVTAPGGVEFVTPLLSVTGDVLDQSRGAGISMQAMRDTFNAHTHGSVASGGAYTAPPNEPM